MHKFMRAIGFSNYTDRSKLKELLKNVILTADQRAYTINEEDIMLGEFSKGFAENMGITVCGEFDEQDKFTYEYYYPYLRGRGITSTEDISVERHASRESYAGVCDDIKVGISLIFYLQNRIPYVKAHFCGELPIRGTSLTLSGLSVQGSILLPIEKDEEQKQRIRQNSVNRTNLIAAARKGDEDAMDMLTMEDMDMYSTISRKIQNEDVFSIVDTYFMPYGVECDHYSVLGEILECDRARNHMTGEEIFLLKICCNELTFDVAINIIDMLGEPKVGRRFKGTIWLQGFINFPDYQE